MAKVVFTVQLALDEEFVDEIKEVHERSGLPFSSFIEAVLQAGVVMVNGFFEAAMIIDEESDDELL